MSPVPGLHRLPGPGHPTVPAAERWRPPQDLRAAEPDPWDAGAGDGPLAALRSAAPGRQPVRRAAAQVGLSLALAKQPRLLLLDEPVAALDALARHEFLSSLAEAAAGGGRRSSCPPPAARPGAGLQLPDLAVRLPDSAVRCHRQCARHPPSADRPAQPAPRGGHGRQGDPHRATEPPAGPAGPPVSSTRPGTCARWPWKTSSWSTWGEDAAPSNGTLTSIGEAS